MLLASMPGVLPGEFEVIVEFDAHVWAPIEDVDAIVGQATASVGGVSQPEWSAGVQRHMRPFTRDSAAAQFRWMLLSECD